MPYSGQTRFNKGVFVFLAALLVLFVVLLSDVAVVIKLVLIAADVFLFLFVRRGYLLFAQGVGLLKKNENEGALKKFRSALKAGVGNEQKTLIATVLIRSGSVNEGTEVLRRVIEENPGKQESAKAGIALSMGLWLKNDFDGAIEILERIKDEGYSDPNLYTNLTTYCLAAGKTGRAGELIAEATEKGVDSDGFADNCGWYYILTAKWEKAWKIYNDLINGKNVSFPEAYLHGAQVAVHKGRYGDAFDFLNWGMGKQFSATSMVTKEYMAKLLRGLEDPFAGSSFAFELDRNRVAVAAGKRFWETTVGTEMSAETGKASVRTLEKTAEKTPATESATAKATESAAAKATESAAGVREKGEKKGKGKGKGEGKGK